MTMDDKYRENMDNLMEIAKAPLIDKLEKSMRENATLKEINGEMLEALKYAVNWGHGFERVGPRPEWLTEAEQAVCKANKEQMI